MFPTLSNDGLLVVNFGYTFQPWLRVVDLCSPNVDFFGPLLYTLGRQCWLHFSFGLPLACGSLGL